MSAVISTLAAAYFGSQGPPPIEPPPKEPSTGGEGEPEAPTAPPAEPPVEDEPKPA